MRKLALALIVAIGPALPGSAQAADLPPAAVPPPVPQFIWTGFYLGGNAGAGWTSATITDTLTSIGASTGTPNSFIGGGQVGYNYQVNSNVVVGVEWFVDAVANNNSNNRAFIADVPLLAFQVFANPQWVSTVTGRLGFTGPGWDHWLVYGKAGGGWVGYTVETNDVLNGLAPTSSTTTQAGWTAGAGIEWAFAPNWTAKIEYQYLGLGLHGFVTDRFAVNNANIQMVTIGVNFLFGWAPAPAIAARY